MAALRMTRTEKRARTRESLLEAAARVFAQKGYDGASLDEIAETAGFSKGAIYSNFDSKEDLFLAVLDEHNRVQQAALTEVLAQGSTLAERLGDLGRWFRQVMETEKDWNLLALEFTMYAARNESWREALAKRDRTNHRTIAAIIREQAGEFGVELPVDADLLASAIVSLGLGMSVHRLVDPQLAPDAVFPTAVALLLGQAPVVDDL